MLLQFAYCIECDRILVENTDAGGAQNVSEIHRDRCNGGVVRDRMENLEKTLVVYRSDSDMTVRDAFEENGLNCENE